MYKILKSSGLVVIALSLTACELQKSENPLSPSVAGPLPGVNITTPRLGEPAGGSRIEVDKQPITLSVENASTSGVRPLAYLFEVATDAQFATKVFTKADVAPGTNGRTSVTLPEPLATGRTYYWRALAQDGANTGSYATPSAFTIYTPIVIEAPVLVSPVGGETVTSVTPRLTFSNAPRSGPVGTIQYQLSLYADAFSEAGFIGIWVVQEGYGQSILDVPPGFLSGGRDYFWVVRAVDPLNLGAFSTVQKFRTPASAPATGTGSGSSGASSGGGTSSGGGSGTDFDGLGPVQIVGGSPDVRSWAVTSRITSLRFSPGNIHLEHTKTGRWPGVDIGGALQEATLWVFFKIGGQWYGTGGERWRPGQTDKVLSAPSAIGPGWFYNGNWAPMTGYVPRPGEQVGFMVVAGSTRVDAKAPVRERSNILLIPFPADGVSASFP